MSQMLHIMGKDARRLRWVLALWLVVVAGYVAMSVTGAAPTGEAFQAQLFFREVLGAFTLAQMLLTGLIVSRLVHEEPLVGFNAFWLTRPYDARALAAAKLMFVAACLIAVPVVGDLVTMGVLDARGPALARGGAASLIAYLTATLPLLVIAVLTPSFGAFVLTIVAIVAAFSMLLSSLAGVMMFLTEDMPRYVPPRVPDATPSIMLTVTFVCAALAVVVYQYRQRRRAVAIGLTVAGAVLTVAVPALWPWSFARGELIQPGEWAARASAVHDASWGIEAVELPRLRGGEARRQINLRITLSDVPADVTVQRIGIRSRLRLEDGTVVESSGMGGYTPSRRSSVLSAALGGATMLVSVDATYSRESWTPVLHLPEQEFLRHRGRSGRLDMTLDFYVTRTREAGVLPISRGAALDRGVSRVEVLEVLRAGDRPLVTIRQWRARSPFTVSGSVEREYALRHAARNEALPAGIENGAPIGSRGNGLASVLRVPFRTMGVGVDVYSGGGGAGFSASTLFLRFPGRGYGEPPELPASWYDEAELVVLETESPAVVSKQLTIENFTIPVR